MTKSIPRPLPTRIAFALLWLFVWILPLTEATEIPGVGTISKVVGLAALIAGAVAVAARRQIRVLGAVHGTMALLILWSAVTLAWSTSPDLTMQRVITYFQLFALVVLIWELCVEEADVLRILSAFVLGTILPALTTLMAFLPGQGALTERASVAGYDPDNMAFMLAISLPIAYYLILRDTRPVSVLYRLQMGIAICAILTGGSAVTLIAMVIGLTLVCWTVHLIPIRTRVNAFALLMVLGGVALIFLPKSVWQNITNDSRNGAITLTAVVNRGAEALHATPPGGFGAGTVVARAMHTPVDHSAYLVMLSETGVVGVVCFISLLAVLYISAERLSGTTRSFWFTVLTVWAVGLFALNWQCSQIGWLLFGLLASHASGFKPQDITPVQRERKPSYYVEEAEVWS